MPTPFLYSSERGRAARPQSKRNVFLYSSDERHSVGDKPGHYRQRTVKLRGTKGTKTESYWKGSKLAVKHKLPLTAKEVSCIRGRKFLPGLWDACTTACQNKTMKRRR